MIHQLNALEYVSLGLMVMSVCMALFAMHGDIEAYKDRILMALYWVALAIWFQMTSQ